MEIDLKLNTVKCIRLEIPFLCFGNELLLKAKFGYFCYEKSLH